MADIHIVDIEERSIKAVLIDGLFEPSAHAGVEFDEKRIYRCLDCGKEFFFFGRCPRS